MKAYSVLMSVYCKEQPEYLQEAMESMWNQTILTDDFVLVCDGPLTAELDAVIAENEGAHPELHVVRLEKNRGLGNALNEGLKHCRNDLVARMDSDDVSRPDRCERQLSALEQDQDLAIISGTVEEFFGTTDNITGRRELPGKNMEIRKFSRKRNPFNHPAVMFSKAAVEAAGGYSEKYHLFEDYYLWVRLLMNGAKAANIKEPILYMRTPADLYMRRGGKQYAQDMLAFHRWMKSERWTSTADYLTGAVPHAVICVLPNRLRAQIYKKLHA